MDNDKQLIYERFLAVTENTRQNPVINSDGNKFWYNKKSKLHREDGPAAEWADGSKFWYINDKQHREDGPAVERSNGTKEWYINGELHREDGPAVERANGSKHWYINGELHREDGPAVEHANGSKHWYISGNYYDTIPEWTKALFEFKEWTPEFLASKGKDYGKLVNIYAQKMINDYGER